ncbi:hypothetical protein M9Y10_005198 [Tritrichomonas musculus]|uniref:Guanylate-binding protein N-terminal domain-containing protein n=1 Tax=Tritrichomonas musculus TaxID=1915356 RepID=A0ABR2JMU8_9EUKA
MRKRMDPTKNKPVQIAFVDKQNNIKWDKKAFRSSLHKSHNRFIKIVIIIGGYQKGKTSLIKIITGNKFHRVGNGEDEETNGVFLDGPYDNFDQEVSIFFADIEGFGSYNRGSVDELNTFYSKLCAPLIAISSCIIFLADLNESRESINQIYSALKLGYFKLNQNHHENNDGFDFSIQMMTLIRNINQNKGISYENPNEQNYNAISQDLTQNWQGKRFQNINFTMNTKPLPVFNKSCDVLDQSKSFKNGIKFILNDLLNTLKNPINRIETKDSDIIINMFKTMIRSPNPLDPTFLKNTNLNFLAQLMKSKIRSIYKENENRISAIITEYENDQNNYKIFTSIEDDERNVFFHLFTKTIQVFIQILEEKLDISYFNLNEVMDEISNIINNDITQLINNRMEIIMNRFGYIKFKQKLWRIGVGITAVGIAGLSIYFGPTAISFISEIGGSAAGAIEGATAEGAVGAAVGSAVEGAVGAAVEGAVGAAVEGAVGAAVEGAVGAAVEGAVGAAVEGAVGAAVEGAVGAAVEGAVGAAVEGAVGAAVEGAVGAAVEGAVGAAVEGAVGAAVEGAVGAAVGAAVEGAVGAAVEGAVGAAVEGAVGAAVEGAVGAAVEGAVGAAVEGAVGAAVEGAVGVAVEGAAVEGAVGAAVEGGVAVAKGGMALNVHIPGKVLFIPLVLRSRIGNLND